MKTEHMLFIDRESYLSLPLRKLPEAFGLSVAKPCYPHYFNSKANVDYVGLFPDNVCFGKNEMSQSERREFITLYDGQKDKVFDERKVLEMYCQDDVAVLRKIIRFSDASLSRSATSKFFSSHSLSPTHVI